MCPVRFHLVCCRSQLAAGSRPVVSRISRACSPVPWRTDRNSRPEAGPAAVAWVLPGKGALVAGWAGQPFCIRTRPESTPRPHPYRLASGADRRRSPGCRRPCRRAHRVRFHGVRCREAGPWCRGSPGPAARSRGEPIAARSRKPAPVGQRRRSSAQPAHGAPGCRRTCGRARFASTWSASGRELRSTADPWKRTRWKRTGHVGTAADIRGCADDRHRWPTGVPEGRPGTHPGRTR